MDLSTFLPIVLVIAIVVAIAIANRRSGREPFNAATLFSRPWELGWPRGVQEEEPVRFRVEFIEHRGLANR
jgi:hypothetical protein